MGDLPEKKTGNFLTDSGGCSHATDNSTSDSVSNSIFPITTLHDAIPLNMYLNSKVFKIDTYYKTQLSHGSRCSNS